MEHSGSCGNNLTWTLDSDGVLTIRGTGDLGEMYHDPDDCSESYFSDDDDFVIKSVLIRCVFFTDFYRIDLKNCCNLGLFGLEKS